MLVHCLDMICSADVACRNVTKVTLLCFADLSGSAEMSKARLQAAIRKCYKSPTSGSSDQRSAEDWSTAVRKSVVAKVCDFGAAFLDRLPEEGPPTRNAHSACGSRSYCDPEVYRIMAFQSMATQAARVWDNSQGQWQEIVDTGYDPYAADVWSYAVVVFTLVTGSKPFHAPCIADNVFRAFLRTTQPHVVHDEICAPWCDRWMEDCLPGSSTGQLKPNLEKWEWPDSMSPQLVDLLSKCLRLRASERISMDDVLHHPWLTGPIDKDVQASSPLKLQVDTHKSSPNKNGMTRPRNSSSASAATSNFAPSSASVVSVQRETHLFQQSQAMRSPMHASHTGESHLQNYGATQGSSAPVQLKTAESDEDDDLLPGTGLQPIVEPMHTTVNVPAAAAAAAGRMTAVTLQQDADELEDKLREAGELQPLETRPDLMASMCTPALDSTVTLSMARSNSSAANPRSPTGASSNSKTSGGGTVWKFTFPAPGAEGGEGATEGGPQVDTRSSSVIRRSRRFSGSQKRAGERSFAVSGFEQPNIPSGLLSPHSSVTSPLASGSAVRGRPAAPRFTFAHSGSNHSGGESPAPPLAPPPTRGTAQPSGAESVASSDATGEAGDVLSPLVAKVRLPSVAPRGAVVNGNSSGGAGGKPLDSGKGRMGGALSRSGSGSSSTSAHHTPPFQLRGSSSLDAQAHPRLDPSNSGASTPLGRRVSGDGVSL